MREVVCADAIEWLKNYQSEPQTSFLASMPDISEFPTYSLSDWKKWFIDTSKLVLEKTSPDGVSIFFQSDIKYEGAWVDKAYLVQKAAEELGHELLWHKIFCRYPAGTTTFGRPAYSHMVCFSKNVKLDLARSTPDVIPDLGDKTWQRGMGLTASLMAAKFIKEEVKSIKVISPFCGEGSFLAAASFLELQSLGIERSPKRAQKARELTVSPDGKCFL